MSVMLKLINDKKKNFFTTCTMQYDNNAFQLHLNLQCMSIVDMSRMQARWLVKVLEFVGIINGQFNRNSSQKNHSD